MEWRALENYIWPLFILGVGENGVRIAKAEATAAEQLKISILVTLMVTGLSMKKISG